MSINSKYNKRFTRGLVIKPLLLFLFILFLSFNASALQAQESYVTGVRVLITDQTVSPMKTIDTLIPPQANLDRVLQQIGYDPYSIAEKQVKNGGQVTIATEEVIGIKGNRSSKSITATADANQSKPSTNAPKLDNTAKVVDREQALTINNFFDFPAGAVVEEMPDGSKKAIITETDALGNIYTKEIRVRMGRTESISSKTNTNAWVQMDDKLPITVDQPLNSVTSTYTNSGGAYPDVSITVAECDMFDVSTINSLHPSLTNAPTLIVNEFLFEPAFNEGYFRLNFMLTNTNKATLHVYDVIGSEIYQEEISNPQYNSLLKKFSLYRKGEFLLLIKSDNQKFTKKLIIE